MMANPRILPPRRLAAALLSLGLVASWHVSAAAQQVVARINGDPITAIDIAQRTKLIQVSAHKTPTRQEVIDELIDEKLKLQTAKRYKLEITDSEVDDAFKNIATRAGSTPDNFAKALNGQGISVEAVKTRIRADMGWSQIIRGKFQSTFQIREKEILDTLQSNRKEDQPAVGYEYTLRPILLIVPRGSSEEVIAARKREAEGLRSRFQNCDEGLRLARGLRDTAVRDIVIRTSGDLTAQLREILDNTAEGKLTAPETTQQGIELYALCRKRQITSELPGKREVREKILQERFADQGKRYLKELRAGAMIEYR
ncbi:MAG: SurA N-terminal domain-containing protein [Xanthobacteraceae bacterium]|jgi:peptidyl-prolyl cis-trans isomerase SurA